MSDVFDPLWLNVYSTSRRAQYMSHLSFSRRLLTRVLASVEHTIFISYIPTDSVIGERLRRKITIKGRIKISFQPFLNNVSIHSKKKFRLLR